MLLFEDMWAVFEFVQSKRGIYIYYTSNTGASVKDLTGDYFF